MPSIRRNSAQSTMRKQESERMRRRTPRTIYVERESSSSFLWFLLGGALGAGLALWFAPQSGDRTRQVVGRKLGKLRDAAEEAFDDFRESLRPAPEPESASPEAEAEAESRPDGAERPSGSQETPGRR